MDFKDLEKYSIDDKKQALESQKEMAESFKQYFGDYEVVFETADELGKKFNDFFEWHNTQWIVPGTNKTPEQLWKELGRPPIKPIKADLKKKFPKDMKKFGLTVDPLFGIVIVPFYGYLKEFFEGDYKNVPDCWGFFYKVIVENDQIIPSFIVRKVILNNKERALKIFKEGYKEIRAFEDVLHLLEKFRDDWNNSPQTWNMLVDYGKVITESVENQETSEEQLKEAKVSMKEFDLAWKEFFKDKPNPQTDEEERREQEEFHYWYNNVRKQTDTGKTPVEMGQRIMNLEWDEEYDENKLEEEFEPLPEAKPWEVTLIEKIMILTLVSFPDQERKAVKNYRKDHSVEIELIQSKENFSRGFNAWFLLEYKLPNGKTPIETIFSRPDFNKLFSKREIKMITHFLAFKQSLFEIKSISENKKDYSLQDIVDNKEYLVKTIDFQADLGAGDFLIANLVEKLEGDYFFYGNVQIFDGEEGLKMKKNILKLAEK